MRQAFLEAHAPLESSLLVLIRPKNNLNRVTVLLLTGTIGVFLGLLIGSRNIPERIYNRLKHVVRASSLDSAQTHYPPREDSQHPNRPLPIIFDTDIGNDIDDVLALALLHELADRREVEILAVTISKDNPWCAPHVDLINT